MLGQASNSWWMFVILGFLAGIASGGLGLGGGIVLVPALVILAGFSQKSAQGMALAVMVPLAMLGAYRYWRNETIDFNLAVVGLIVAGSLLGTLLGTELAIRLPGHFLRKLFAVCLILVAVRMFIGADKTSGRNVTGTSNSSVPDQKTVSD